MSIIAKLLIRDNKIMNDQKQGFAPIILVILAALAIAGGTAYFIATRPVARPKTESREDKTTPSSSTQSQKEEAQSPPPTGTGSTPSGGIEAELAGLRPKEVYMRMAKEADSAKTYDEFMAISMKYADKASQEQYRQDAAKITQAGKETVFKFFQLLNPKSNQIRTIEENIQGNEASLTILTNDPKFKGSSTMAKENGVWKFHSKKPFSSATQSQTTPVVQDTIAIDPIWDWKLSANWKIFSSTNLNVSFKYPPSGRSTGLRSVGILSGGYAEDSLYKYIEERYRIEKNRSASTGRATTVRFNSYDDSDRAHSITARVEEMVEADGYLSMHIYISLPNKKFADVMLSSYQTTGVSAGDPTGYYRLQKLEEHGSDYEYLRKVKDEILNTVSLSP